MSKSQLSCQGGHLRMGWLGFTGLARKLEHFRNEEKCDDNDKLQRLGGLT